MRRWFLVFGGNFPVFPRVIATIGGIGFVPGFPGTAGSAAGVGLYWLLYQGGSFFPFAAFPLIAAVAVWSSDFYARESGRQDPQEIVVDEVAGQMLCLLGTPPVATGLGAGFLIFRLFDVWKPFRRVETLPGGWGIVADDILAGILGWCVLALGRFAGYL